MEHLRVRRLALVLLLAAGCSAAPPAAESTGDTEPATTVPDTPTTRGEGRGDRGDRGDRAGTTTRRAAVGAGASAARHPAATASSSRFPPRCCWRNPGSRPSCTPDPAYEGNPWSQWGQGIVLADGRFLSAIGDHCGEDGNSYLYSYDPATSTLTQFADVLSIAGPRGRRLGLRQDPRPDGRRAPAARST